MAEDPNDKFDAPAKLGEVVFVVGQATKGLVGVLADVVTAIGRTDPALATRIVDSVSASLVTLEREKGSLYERVAYDGFFNEMKRRGLKQIRVAQ